MIRDKFYNRSEKITGEKWKKYSIELPEHVNCRLEHIKEAAPRYKGKGFSYHNLFLAALNTTYCLDADTYRVLICMLDEQIDKCKEELSRCCKDAEALNKKLNTRIEQLEDMKFIYQISSFQTPCSEDSNSKTSDSL